MKDFDNPLRFMLYAKFLLITFFVTRTHESFSQVKWQTDYYNYYTEKYQVIFGVKHGTFYRLSGRQTQFIHFFGNYVQNMRNGNWYFFYPVHDGPLHLRGQYLHDKKEGPWFEYYPSAEPPGSRGDTIRRSAIAVSKSLPGERFLVYDTTGLQRMSLGFYAEDKKVGAWSYFNSSGLLIHRYDHSDEKLTVNYLPDSLKRQCTFLGGPDRLLATIMANQADADLAPFGGGQEAIVLIGAPNEHVTYAIFNPPRNRRFEKYVLTLFQNLPNDWLIDENDPRMIKLRVTTVQTEYSNRLSISFVYDGKESTHW